MVAISNSYENSRRYSQVNTGDKLFSGINDTGHKLLPVSMLLAINYCVVDSHRFHDTGDKFVASNNDTVDE
jgi:hypothetical protein